MLLTVIAVATLLVAVVGATFAYFSVTNSTNSETTIRASVENVGTIALTQGEAFHLNINAEDMADSKKEQVYYSVKSSSGDSSTSENYENVATVALTGGDADVKYKCTGTLKVEILESDSAAELSSFEFKEDEAKVKISTDNSSDVTFGSSFQDEIDVFSLKEKNYTVEDTVTINITGNGSTVSKNIKGYLSIKNTTENQADRLSGKEFTVKVTVNNFKCDTVEASA